MFSLSGENSPARACVLVIGAGAIGSIAAARIQSTAEVYVVEDWEPHARVIASRGVKIEGVRPPLRRRLSVLQPRDVQTIWPVELVLIAVKAPRSDYAVEIALEACGRDSTVISLQNGIQEENLADRVGSKRVVGAVTEIGGYVEGPGRVIETRRDGGFVIGELNGPANERTRQVASLLTSCASVEISPNIRGHLWSKLLWNCMLNPLSALTGLGQGELLADDRLRALCLTIAAEVRAVADATGVVLEPLHHLGIDPAALSDVEPRRWQAAERDMLNRYRDQWDKTTSMRRDVESGRLTEVDQLNGHVVNVGSQCGIQTPVNSAIVRHIHALERSEIPQSRDAVAEVLTVAAKSSPARG